mgnify:CR=1 FL=1
MLPGWSLALSDSHASCCGGVKQLSVPLPKTSIMNGKSDAASPSACIGAGAIWALSPLTLPHALVRVVVAIYRDVDPVARRNRFDLRIVGKAGHRSITHHPDRVEFESAVALGFLDDDDTGRLDHAFPLFCNFARRVLRFAMAFPCIDHLHEKLRFARRDRGLKREHLCLGGQTPGQDEDRKKSNNALHAETPGQYDRAKA